MKLSQLILPTVAFSVAGLFVMPSMEEAEGWSLLGGSLSQAQRDFRIYNNFTDPVANNNVTPHASFPGYLGAQMAIWKGVVEWSSTLHGDGSGDPIQTVGSGLANFDPYFLGAANQVGNTNSNIHSEISGSSGGTLAFCESPISDGWRIRYYENPSVNFGWSDGPGSPSSGRFDLQGVAAHEYGHALGLDHSSFNNATMAPGTAPGTTGARSIANDDRNGLAAIYGAASATKPTITGVNIAGGQITVTGTNFSPTNNEIWFTRATPGGTPLTVTGLTSNGTTVTAAIPVEAGPGDVLVRKNSTAHDGLSNPWPVDIAGGGGCTTPTNYCSFQPNSAGIGAQITSSNLPSLSANNFVLQSSDLPPNKVGLYFYGPNQQDVPFGDGRLCISGSITRLPAQVSDSLGFADLATDFTQSPFDAGNGQAVVGGTMNFQFWYRDPGFGVGFNTTNGLSVTFCP